MSRAERIRRWEKLNDAVNRADVGDWLRSFVGTLRDCARDPAPERAMAEPA